MTHPPPPQDRGGFGVAIICALKLEAHAVEALFDRCWENEGKRYGKALGDPNAYTTGLIGRHNAVLAHMPGMGKGSAAGVASGVRSSFWGIELALVVGICGGVPYETSGEEILLGDVIISDGIVEYDFGRLHPDKFVRKNTVRDSLGRPNLEIRSLLNGLEGYWSGKRFRSNISRYLRELQKKPGFKSAGYPGADADKLFESTYRHKHHDFQACALCCTCKKKEDEVCQAVPNLSCSMLKCDENKLVPRSRLSKDVVASSAEEPRVHYGFIASGDTVMKSAEDRDAIATIENVIAFEMEGAGVWDKLPCVIIKGVCDYADSHKNKIWQEYAAATAAACMKAFLEEWVPTDKPWQSIAPPSE
jgi:nucleoside phosphorylase